jgi:quinol-cytochrome oxidoreductase complex cytochrome b subunit
MNSKKAFKLWTVNVLSFILFILLSITGLLNWLVLPRGYEARKSVLVSVRHFLITIHEWTALIFMATIAIHIILHWTYIRSNLKKYSTMK